MPTRRIAEKSAALEAVKQLHKANELNEHLLPFSKVVNSSDEDETTTTEEKKKKHAGTAKRSDYYPNKVLKFIT